MLESKDSVAVKNKGCNLRKYSEGTGHGSKVTIKRTIEDLSQSLSFHPSIYSNNGDQQQCTVQYSKLQIIIKC